MSAQPGKITKYTVGSQRSGGFRSTVKKETARRARRLGRRIARGDEKAEGESLTHGWAD